MKDKIVIPAGMLEDLEAAANITRYKMDIRKNPVIFEAMEEYVGVRRVPVHRVSSILRKNGFKFDNEVIRIWAREIREARND